MLKIRWRFRRFQKASTTTIVVHAWPATPTFVIRDQLVHDTVQVYRLEEVRLKSEEIIQKQSFSSTAVMLLQVSREDIPGVRVERRTRSTAPPR